MKKIYESTISSFVSLALLAYSMPVRAGDINMIDNVSASITKNNTSEFLVGLPPAVQSQQLYSMTSGKPYLIALNYTDHGITFIYMISSNKNFKTGEINMTVKLLNPVEESQKWDKSQEGRGMKKYNGYNPYKQFTNPDNALLNEYDQSLKQYNWNKANISAIPALLNLLASQYEASQMSFVQLESWTGTDSWSECVKRVMKACVKRQSFGANKVWIKPHIYTSELRENMGTRGAFSSYKINDCIGTEKECNVISNRKFIKLNDGEITSQFQLQYAQNKAAISDAGWNLGVVLFMVSAVAGCFACAAAFAAGAALAGNDIINMYVSSDKLLTAAVITSLGPSGALLGGSLFSDKDVTDSTFGYQAPQLLGLKNPITGTDSSLKQIKSMKIDRNTLESAQTALNKSAQGYTDLYEVQENRASIDKVQGDIYNSILTATIQGGTTTGIGSTMPITNYKMGKEDYAFRPYNNILNNFFRNDNFTTDGVNVNPTFSIPILNSLNNRYTRQVTQQETNDVELLQNVGNEKSFMMQLGGNTYSNNLRRSDYYNGETPICSPNAASPC